MNIDAHAELHQHLVAALRAVYGDKDVVFALAWIVRDELKDQESFGPADVNVTASKDMGHALVTFAAAKTIMPPERVKTNRPS